MVLPPKPIVSVYFCEKTNLQNKNYFCPVKKDTSDQLLVSLGCVSFCENICTLCPIFLLSFGVLINNRMFQHDSSPASFLELRLKLKLKG